ncbi:group IIE secretory phospholipase A2 isoform X1 [Peromyscus eremicus]|uniref:group IIE secretory phospholipase A2 isoform X1 n=1 Tax=Peromyscus eremicus TaxID=42410 RepID=UPI0027DE57B8|nr:group IIE secretory phospholipase A2 isoform X1 [Peromyscus eremicus]
MKPPLALTFLCLLVSPTGGNLVQFGVMIERITGKSALQYNDYGCYCGVGGSNWPVDQTDWCCHAHDCCYGRLKKLGCEPKLEKYLFSVGRDTISCAGRSTCQRQTCECDRRAALCFRHNLGTYNRKPGEAWNPNCSPANPTLPSELTGPSLWDHTCSPGSAKGATGPFSTHKTS